jgi:hypothetical protein
MAKSISAQWEIRARSCCGTTVAELLVATLIASLLGMLAMGTLLASIKANTTTSARVDINNNLARALERLACGIRAGENLGDVNRPYGTAERWVCDNTNLVVQVPVTNADGFTYTINDPVPGDDPVARENVETLVYQIAPDPSVPGTYLLKMTRYPGAAQGTYVPPKQGTQTLLTGIIGPVNPNTGKLKIFQYVNLTDPAGTVRDTVDMTQAANYKIVVVNVETIKRDRKGKTLESLGFKSEYFLRNSGR